MFGDKTLVFVVVATVVFLALAMTQLVRAWEPAQAGLVMYERTCPIHTTAAAARHAR